MNIGEEEVLFYHEIGLTLSQWAYAENQLLQVLCVCLSKVSERKMLAASFLSIENFRSKLAFCDSMISVKFSDSPHLAYWNQLSKKLHAASAKRNKIAHHMSVMYVEGDIGRRFALIPWLDGDRSPATPQPSAPANGGKLKPPTDSLCLREIAGIRLEFYELTKALANLCQLLAMHVEPFPGSPEPINDLPSIQSLRNQMRAALGVPLAPSRKKRSKEDST
jgi:hypothetical protein